MTKKSFISSFFEKYLRMSEKNEEHLRTTKYISEKQQIDEKNPAMLRIAEIRAEERIEFCKKGLAITNNKDYLSRRSSIINLGHLGLQVIPESLRELKDLQVIDIIDNDIQEIPHWIGDLSSLEAIRLSRNKLRTLPTEIGSLRKLRVLYLDHNHLETLPEALLQLQLNSLDLEGNPELQIPQSLLSARPEEILRYYFESRDEKGKPLLELKLLLVGRGKAGKTTILKQLAGEKPDKSESETHSIAIRELTLGCKHGQVRTRAWDFGGQEILHSTHQFFLTERSLYLLVLEPRTGLAQRDAEYWLKLIETQGNGSPVIIVMNWSHEHPWRVDEVKLRRKFPFIVNFIATDALHGDGIETLRQSIIQTIEQRMQEIWLPFPERWREIKDAVAGMHQNFLTHSQYTKLCAMHDENDAAAQADLAGILHALGLALYYGKDPRLHDTRVLNPGWVTGGVYAVIRSPLAAKNHGQLAVSDISQILCEAEQKKVIKASDYPPETHSFILELMRAFHLCYASEKGKNKQSSARPNSLFGRRRLSPFGKAKENDESKPVRYLVPELLPEFEPEMTEIWENSPVHLRYRYEILPPGLLPRFIVRTHALSDGAPHWRHGVVLIHAESKALIRMESDKPELHVFILDGDAETQSVLVTIVRCELDMLHDEMKMQPVEELELTGKGQQWISVKALLEIEQPEKPTLRLPIQPEGTAEVNVSLELNKLVPAEARAIDRNPETAPFPVRVFVSYAHDDERQLKRLDAILGVLEQQYGLASWRDRRLIAGEEWDEEIRRRLEEMDIFLLIASQISLVRPYIRNPELKRAIERRNAGNVEIVVVKLEPCACDDDPILGKLQRLAPKFKSIAEASPRSKAWEQVRKDLLPVIQRVREKKKAAEG